MDITDNNYDYRRLIWIQEDLVFIKSQSTDNSITITDNSNTQQSNSEKVEVD